jgi:putative hydrolase of HD superfamily
MKHRIRAAGLVLDPDQRILLVRETDPITGAACWVPPGGGLEAQDGSVIECLKREVREETGLSIEAGRLVYWREFAGASEQTHHLELYFEVREYQGQINPAASAPAAAAADLARHAQWFRQADLSRLTVYPEHLKREFWDDRGAGVQQTRYLGLQVEQMPAAREGRGIIQTDAAGRAGHTPVGERLSSQLAFLDEIEKLKLVYRRNQTIDRSRFENSAEHSWHVALMALVLAEHAGSPALDVLKVVKLLLIHDLVEIYAGDTWIYDIQAAKDQAQREALSADQIFGMLPTDQAAEFRALWDEFAARDTPEARFAAAIDALQPLTNHLLSGMADPAEPAPTRDEVIERKRHIAASSPALWEVAQSIIAASARAGLYREA